MNLLKSPLRRTTAALAGAFIGLAGAVAFAAPASAHQSEHTGQSELTGKTSCVDDGGWKVDWTLTSKAPIDGQIAWVKETPGDTALKNIKVGAPVPTGGSITESQTFGKDVAEVTLVVKVAYDMSAEADAVAASTKDGDWKPGDDKTYLSAKVNAPMDCEQPPGHPPAQPSAILEQDCDSMTIGLHNPADGEKVVLELMPSKGEDQTLVIKPGETKTATFQATPGFTVSASINGSKPEPVPYVQPKECENGGTAGGGETGGGGLAKTGAAAGSIAGGAAVLLIAGGSMFVLARRRKVKFTA